MTTLPASAPATTGAALCACAFGVDCRGAISTLSLNSVTRLSKLMA